MNRTTVEISCKLIIPAEQIAWQQLSLPAADILPQIPSLVGQQASEIERALEQFDSSFANLPEDERRKVLEELRRRLDGVGQDAVWLIPSCLKAKPGYEAHMAPYRDGHEPTMLGFGLRDTYQNLFKVGYLGGDNPQVLHRPNEPLESRRYAMLYSPQGASGLAIGKARFSGNRVSVEGEKRPIEFGVTSPPIVWDGRPVPLATRVGFQSDLRHELHIAPQNWQTVHTPLQQEVMSHDDPAAAGASVLSAAANAQLRRENGYYLSSVGVGGDGQLILISAHGSVDDLVDLQLKAGAQRALLTEEGGSCAYALWECKKDFGAADQIRRCGGAAEWQEAPRCFGMNTYWRPNALALCVVGLKNFVVESPFLADPASFATDVAFD